MNVFVVEGPSGTYPDKSYFASSDRYIPPIYHGTQLENTHIVIVSENILLDSTRLYELAENYGFTIEIQLRLNEKSSFSSMCIALEANPPLKFHSE